MQLFSPEILTDARGLSVGVSATGLAVGFVVWLTGWWGHRFWTVLVMTVLAGVFGLLSSPAHRVQPLVGGLLLAVAAGVLALALMRMLAFASGGIGLWLTMHAVAPPPWDDPLVCFLVGGLVGLLLFRLWMMVLTSFAGALLMGYSALCLADRLGKIDALEVVGTRGELLSGACLGVAGLGLVIQFVIDRFRKRRAAAGASEHEADRAEYQSHLQRHGPEGRWPFGKRYRRVG
jgi:hypothetical protein